jgi:AmmeMemoRadiSam system protein B
MPPMPFRPAAVAGTWYPGRAAALAAEVDRYVADADLEPLPSHPRAIVAPHAGLRYSGPVAAFAYKAVRDARYAAAILVGPSHFVTFDGVSIWPGGSWGTPFGPVAVDAALAGELTSAMPGGGFEPAAHGREHSLEMHLPFVARLLPAVPIVPVVMGHQTRETAAALGDALARAAAAASGAVLLVASSDLSHYEPASRAAELDAVVIRHVEALDSDGLMDTLEREPRHACGGGPIAAVLSAATRRGAAHARVLRYADSGDVSGDKSAVVGYLAAGIW